MNEHIKVSWVTGVKVTEDPTTHAWNPFSKHFSLCIRLRIVAGCLTEVSFWHEAEGQVLCTTKMRIQKGRLSLEVRCCT